MELNQIKKFSYTDILGWSVSRHDKFMLCRRQYYYDYYAKYDTEYGRLKIDSLKKMTSIPLEIGNIVHDVIKVFLERLLKTEKAIDKTKFLKYAEEKTNEYCKSKTFSEVYYKAIPSLDIKLLFEKVELILNNLINSKRYNWIIDKAIENKRGWVIEPPGYGETRINDLKAYCKVDFLFPVENKIYILDWKTGKKDEIKHKKQLVGYSLWASYHFGKKPEDIVPIDVYMKPVYEEMQIEVTGADIEKFSNTVKEETKAMYEFCDNIEKNIPKGKDKFEQTQNLSICNYCNYRELCSR
ncbi:PD-(D/E)XK nuclease family protein [Elusimicrobiota bacterium]